MSKIVVKDFMADHCPPCRRLKPLLATLAAERGLKVEVVNVSQDREQAAAHNIKSVPTLVGYLDGAEIGRQVGFSGRGSLERFLSGLQHIESSTLPR